MKYLASILFAFLAFSPLTASAAIAFDATSQSPSSPGWNAGSNTYSWSHTVTGTDTVIVVAVVNYNPSLLTATSVTYDGMSLTLATSTRAALEGNIQDVEMWYLAGAPTGTHNITVNLSASATDSFFMADSYTGVSQTSPLDSFATGRSLSAVTSFGLSTNTVAKNAWLVGFVFERGGTPSAGTNTMIRSSNSGTYGAISDSNSAQSPAGSYSQNYTFGSGTVPGAIVISLAPFGASSPSSSFGYFNSFWW